MTQNVCNAHFALELSVDGGFSALSRLISTTCMSLKIGEIAVYVCYISVKVSHVATADQTMLLCDVGVE